MSAKVQETDLIGREELREKLDQGDSFKLVMVLGESVYLAKRIPRSSVLQRTGLEHSTRTRR